MGLDVERLDGINYWYLGRGYYKYRHFGISDVIEVSSLEMGKDANLLPKNHST